MLQRNTEFKEYNIHLFWHQSYNIKYIVLIGVVGLLDKPWCSPCPDSSTVLLTPPFPSLNSMAYLPVSFSVGSVICSHSWSPTTPLLIRSEKAMAESLAASRRNAQQTHHATSGWCECKPGGNRLENSLVVPGYWQQVVVVADKSVESDAFTCTGDLQRSGRIGCGWESVQIISFLFFKCARRIWNIYVIFSYRWIQTLHSSDLWNLEEKVMIQSGQLDDSSCEFWISQRLPWSVRFKVDVSFPLSSFSTTS